VNQNESKLHNLSEGALHPQGRYCFPAIESPFDFGKCVEPGGNTRWSMKADLAGNDAYLKLVWSKYGHAPSRLLVLSRQLTQNVDYFDAGIPFAWQNHRMKLKNATNVASTPATRNLVLVVDDDTDFCELMTDWLSAGGISCISANSVAKAIAILQKKKIALALLDWALDKSGAEVLRYCKENRPLMPVIAMSGQTFDVRTDALTGQADGFLDKTALSSTVVVSHVNQWLNRLNNTPRTFLPRQEQEITPLDQLKGIYIRHVVQLLKGNVSLAAEKLGIHRQTVATVMHSGPGI
jgi:ActR/RegA family two-component response regulator